MQTAHGERRGARLRPDGDNGRRVEVEVPPARVRVLVQQPVQLPQQLHHALVARPSCEQQRAQLDRCVLHRRKHRR